MDTFVDDIAGEESPDALPEELPPVEELPRVEGAAPKEASPTSEIRYRLGGSLGIAVAGGGFGFGPDLALRGSVALRPGGALRIGFGVSGSTTGKGGEIVDPRYESVEYSTRQWLVRIAPVVELRLLPATESLSPELWAGPALDVRVARVGGTIDGEAFTPTRETNTTVGAQLGAGFAGRIGALELGAAVVVDVFAPGGWVAPKLQGHVAPVVLARWTW